MATEKRLDLIDRKELVRLYSLWVGQLQSQEDEGDLNGVQACLEVLKEQPTVDAVEVVHGWWVSDKADILFHCSVCETQISTDWDYEDLSWNYCPNCGAKMDGGGNG